MKNIIETMYVLILLAILSFIFGRILTIGDSGKINSGKEFILGNATYKCIKTNELKESK